MYITDISADFSAPNNRWAMPGTPIMPVPSMFNNEMLSTVLKPHTHFSRISSPLDQGCVRRCVRGCVRGYICELSTGGVTFRPRDKDASASFRRGKCIANVNGNLDRGRREGGGGCSVEKKGVLDEMCCRYRWES